MKALALGVAGLVSLAALANGAFMLIAPMDWYFAVPGVIDTGGANNHFIRDIGLIFVLISAAFGAGILSETYRLPLWAGATLWLGGHAAFHLWEVAVGICGPSTLVRDFPAVSLPFFIGLALTAWAAKDRKRSA